MSLADTCCLLLVNLSIKVLLPTKIFTRHGWVHLCKSNLLIISRNKIKVIIQKIIRNKNFHGYDGINKNVLKKYFHHKLFDLQRK